MGFRRWLSMIPLRFRSLFHRSDVEQDLDDEMLYHIERQTEQYIANGLRPQEAHDAALRDFGGIDQLKEKSRDTRRVHLIEDLGRDLLYGLRILWRNRGITAIAVLTLALGFGANTAIFTLINTVLLRPLPYETPDRLVRIWARNQKQEQRLTVSPAEFFDLQERSQVFAEIAALYPAGGGTLTGSGEPERMNGARVSARIFPVLGVSPLLGRTFTPAEDRPGTERNIVISYSLWQRRFSGERDIVGKTIVLSGNAYTVIGVLPSEFATPAILAIDRDVWTPLGLDPALNRPDTRYLRIYGKLKPGITLQQAQSEMDALASQRAAAYPETNANIGIEVVPLHEEMAGQVRPALLMLAGAAGFLLLIACANVANLLLARSMERRKEIAVRLAMGAGRARLIRQLLTEVSLLFLLGGGLGFLLAYGSNSLLVTLVTGMLPRARETALDTTVLLFTCGVSLATALLFGLVPALEASNPQLTETMKATGNHGFRNRGRYMLRSWIVISEVALSLVLLVGAGLLIEAFVRLRAVDPGFNPDRILNTRISLPAAGYPEGRGILSFNQQLIEHVENLPGVESAAVLDWIPLGDTGVVTSFAFENVKGSAEFRVASAGYFRTMSIPFKEGRHFSTSDTASSPPVFIISEAAARRYWPGTNPVGKRITVQSEAAVTGEIVGIVGDVKHSTLYEDPAPTIYAPNTQPPWMTRETRELLVRTAGDPLALSDAVRRQIWALEKDVPITGFRSMNDVVSTALAQPSFYALLVGLFAGLALVLASVGIYGVVSHWAHQQKREIAIRKALGARAADTAGLMLRQAGALIAIGISIGLAAAFTVTQFLSRLPFFIVSPRDPAILLGGSLFLTIIALLACYVPVRAASQVDPMDVLRHE